MLGMMMSMLGVGCGTTKWSDTTRTATEQLLISDAMDRAVSRIDFRALAGRTVYLDSDPLKKATDYEYLVSSLRQHLLASGCIVKEKREEADYILEARTGAVGTDRHDVLYGVQATTLPVSITGGTSTIPEIPLAKKTECRAVVKMALFAYNRETGRPVWQSGITPVESHAKDVWFCGTGPFRRGTIYDGTKFAGSRVNIPLVDQEGNTRQRLSVADEAYFAEPTPEAPKPEEQLADQKGAPGDVKAASHSEPTGGAKPADAKPDAKSADAPPSAPPTTEAKPAGDGAAAPPGGTPPSGSPPSGSPPVGSPPPPGTAAAEVSAASGAPAAAAEVSAASGAPAAAAETVTPGFAEATDTATGMRAIVVPEPAVSSAKNDTGSAYPSRRLSTPVLDLSAE